MDERKYSKCAIASFVLAMLFILLLLIPLFALYPWYTNLPTQILFWIMYLLPPASIVLGIFGLRVIKKEGLKGKALAVIGIVQSAIIILLFVLLFSMRSRYDVGAGNLITDEPDPKDADASNPLTLSRDNIVTKSGDGVVLKVSIFNPLNRTLNNATLKVARCTEGVDYHNDPEFITIPSKASENGFFIVNFSGKRGTTSICEISVSSEGYSYAKDIVVRIK